MALSGTAPFDKKCRLKFVLRIKMDALKAHRKNPKKSITTFSQFSTTKQAKKQTNKASKQTTMSSTRGEITLYGHMMDDINLSWDQIKEIPEYETQVGAMLLKK